MKSMKHGGSKSYDKTDKELDIFNGIKFFLILLVIGTCTAFYLLLGAPINPWILNIFVSNFTFTFVLTGLIAMDSFFTFSAFFGFYRICQIYDAKHAIGANFSFKDVIKIYGKRLFRITPFYYLTFLTGIFLIPRLSNGGIWYSFEQALFKGCDRYWWTNILFISNFIPWD